MLPRSALFLLLALASACRTYDPQVFDAEGIARLMIELAN